ncbi:DUF3231 family protein [Dehalobacter sp.]|uniref:DUF3231 family protein n=1 Tax=Dehalobacter sp. TaxID=1962289 RepID=UPI00258A0154|nr:DUF3231 family protein [Dehalobacter sp.]MDJ0306419.1 DUF3231 family protein [Dehalobacter sp.]
MTILDKVNATSRSIVQKFVDKEPANYIEAGLLYQIVVTGRYHVALLTIFHNHAKDLELMQLIKDALDNLSEKTIKKCEDLLQTEDAMIPTVRFPERLLESAQNIPSAAHLSDMEIAMALVNMHGASQMALLTAINQCYHLEIGIELRKQLNIALDWGYRLLQLMLHRGWLPQIAKVEH